MDFHNLPPAVQELANLGDAWQQPDWLDYLALGLSGEHIPALIQVVEQRTRLWATWEEGQPQVWMPVHAWRALAQLGAAEAVPALLATLREIDDEGNDLIQEDLPDVLALIGLPAAAATAAYLNDPGNPLWARIAASHALCGMALAYPEARVTAVQSLAAALEAFYQNDKTLNSFLVDFLAGLEASEAAPLVELAYRAGQVNVGIIGDFEDYQVAVGLLEYRLNPRRPARRVTQPRTMPNAKRVDLPTPSAWQQRLKLRRKSGKRSRRMIRKPTRK